MNIEHLFGSKTKVDILKYLIFRWEWISARELESHLNQSFPAIKKQIDNLELAGIVNKNKTGNRWQICIKSSVKPVIFKIFLFDMLNFLQDIKKSYHFLDSYYVWDLFFLDLDEKIWADLIFVYNEVEDIFLQDVKKQISEFFDKYFLDVKIVFLKKNDYEKRLKFADKFVLRLTKANQEFRL